MPAPSAASAPGIARPALGRYLAIAFSLLSVLVTAVLVLVSERVASAQVRSAIAANLAELAQQTTSRLDRSMFERYREVKLISGRLSGAQPPEVVRAELEALQRTYPHYAWIGLTDPAGHVTAATGGLLAGADVSPRPWFKAAREGTHVGDVHEAVLLAKLLPPTPTGEPHRFVDIAFPVAWPGQGGPGVLGVHLSWAWAREVEQAIFSPTRVARTVEPIIVSASGVVLLGPEDVLGRKLELPSLIAAARGGGTATERWPDGRDYLVGYSRDQGYLDYPGLGWHVLVRQQVAEAHAPVRRLQLYLLGWGLAIAALFSLLGWAAARLITRPLHDLVQAARELEAGGPARPLQVEPYREVAQLGTALDSLVTNLRQKEADLRELNATLERRVEERTAALHETFAHVRENEHRIQAILESAPDPFVGIDFQGLVTDWNPQAEALFGWRRDEVLGRPLVEVLIPQRFRPRVAGALQAFQATGDAPFTGQPLERVVVDRAGREMAVEVRAGRIDSGKLQLLFAFMTDISHRKEVERLKSEFVSTVSHELRTPLTSVYGSLRLLGAGMAGSLPAQGQQLLEMSTRSCERLIRLINDVLDVSKIESGRLELKLERHGLRGLVDRALRDTDAYASGLGVTVRLQADDDPVVRADGDRVIQVVVNLVSNAAKFSPAGGEVLVTLQAAGGRARVGVVDRGPGIPAEFRARVFDRFAQADASDRRQKGGTGLGLNICRSIVQAHGGTIGFDSEPGVRTEFFFELPLEADA